MADNASRFSIGSSVTCDVVLADETVAARHAELEVIPNGPLILVDAGSGRPTRVVHRGHARTIRKGIVEMEDALQFGEVEIPVAEVLTAIQLKHPQAEWRRPPSTPDPHDPARGAHDEIAGKTPPVPRDVRVAEGVPAARVAPAPLTKSLQLPCPKCQKLTNSLKRHRLNTLLLFLWLFWRTETAEYTACPSCMRGILLRLTLINLPTANVMWPIVAVPNTIHFVGTFARGHSKKVRNILKV